MNLAARPDYQEVFREEVDCSFSFEGPTRAAIDKLVKLDSFFKESIRMNGLAFSEVPTIYALESQIDAGNSGIPEESFTDIQSLQRRDHSIWITCLGAIRLAF